MNHRIAIRIGILLTVAMCAYAVLSLQHTTNYANESLPLKSDALVVDVLQDSVVHAIDRVYLNKGKTDISIDSTHADFFELRFPNTYAILDLALTDEGSVVRKENEEILKEEGLLEIRDEGDYHIIHLKKSSGYITFPAYMLVDLLQPEG